MGASKYTLKERLISGNGAVTPSLKVILSKSDQICKLPTSQVVYTANFSITNMLWKMASKLLLRLADSPKVTTQVSTYILMYVNNISGYPLTSSAGTQILVYATWNALGIQIRPEKRRKFINQT